MKQPKVIVLASDPFGVGGIQRATRNFLAALSGIYGSERVALLSLWSDGVASELDWYWVHRGLRGGGRVGFFQAASFVLASIRQARRWRSEQTVIVAMHPHLSPVAWAASKLSGRPYGVWCHGREVWGPLPWKVKQGLAKADLILSVSSFTALELQKRTNVRAEYIRVIPFAPPADWPLEEVGQRSQDGFALTVSRLSDQHYFKGVETLIRGWAEVLVPVPRARLHIVGDGPGRPHLESLVKEQKMDKSIFFLGNLSDEELRGQYRNASVFVLPCRIRLGIGAGGEGFGLVFLEAALAGIPVVAGRGGAVEEIVIDGKTGILVDPEDPSAVASAVTTLLEDPELAEKFGTAARKRVLSEFSQTRYEEQLRGTIQNLLYPSSS